MNRFLPIFALVVLAMCGCTATKPASPPTAEERLMQDGKLLYELGRVDEARSRLNLLLAQTSNEHVRASASYYLDRIEKGLAPEKGDPRVPQCFAP